MLKNKTQNNPGHHHHNHDHHGFLVQML